jgi:hypothetical protein
MKLSFTICCTSNFSPIDTAVIVSECYVLLLISSLQSALCNGDPFSATELMRRKHKHRFRWSSSACEELHACGHEILRIYDHWLEELLVGELEYLLFWQSAWWNRGLIQHLGKKQPGTLQIIHEFLHAVLDMQLESINFFFSFLISHLIYDTRVELLL